MLAGWKNLGRKKDGKRQPPVFGYFDRPDTSLISAFIADWSREFPGFRVYSDADVVPILNRLMPGADEIYLALRLPAAKSDIARLALLHAHGGLYVDCHCGLRDAAWVRAELDALGLHEIIAIERTEPAPVDPNFPRHLINGILFGRQSSPILEDLARQGLENLQRHLALIASSETPPDYDIWSMLGAYVLTTMILEPASDYTDFRRALRGGRVKILPLPQVAIQLSAHRRLYNGPKKVLHWTRRQQEEPLFDPALLPALLRRFAPPKSGPDDPAI